MSQNIKGLQYPQLKMCHITSVCLVWRSDAAANVRRQGCKSLTGAHCLVGQHLRTTLICFKCVYVLLLCEWNFSTRDYSQLFSSVQIRAKDSCFFTLKCFDDSVHHFKVSPKNDPEATRKVRLIKKNNNNKRLHRLLSLFDKVVKFCIAMCPS